VYRDYIGRATSVQWSFFDFGAKKRLDRRRNLYNALDFYGVTLIGDVQIIR
jgi:hypothetical protein